jgi:hypothetical protein
LAFDGEFSFAGSKHMNQAMATPVLPVRNLSVSKFDDPQETVTAKRHIYGKEWTLDPACRLGDDIRHLA